MALRCLDALGALLPAKAWQQCYLRARSPVAQALYLAPTTAVEEDVPYFHRVAHLRGGGECAGGRAPLPPRLRGAGEA